MNLKVGMGSHHAQAYLINPMGEDVINRLGHHLRPAMYPPCMKKRLRQEKEWLSDTRPVEPCVAMEFLNGDDL